MVRSKPTREWNLWIMNATASADQVVWDLVALIPVIGVQIKVHPERRKCYLQVISSLSNLPELLASYDAEERMVDDIKILVLEIQANKVGFILG